MDRPVFTGVGVALLTLFDGDGVLDAEASGDLAARLVDVGVRAVVVAGTTGEAFSLSRDERRTLLRTVRERVRDRAPVVAGTGAAEVGEAVELTRDAVDGGADAVLALSPRGVEDPRPYYERVAEAAASGGADVPLLAYHFPSVSPPGIPVGRLPELPVAGLKDSSGEPGRLLEELERFGGAIYTGSASILSFAGPLGCAGAILSLANVEPERCAEAFAGDPAAQRALGPSIRAARASFPGSLKAMARERWGTSPVARPAA